MSLACELWYSQSRVGVVGSMLFRAAGYTESGFYDLIYIAFITAWQSFIKEGACHGYWGAAHFSIAVQLFSLFKLDLGFWLKMLLRRRLLPEATLPSGCWPSQVEVYISLGTSRNLHSFNCRSLILH